MYGYARVSRKTQCLDMQITALLKAGVLKENIFTEKMSGTKDNRPQFLKVKEILQEGDTLYVYRVDRLSRISLTILCFADDLKKRGIDLKSTTEAIDIYTQIGWFTLTIIAAMLQLERDVLVERTKHGLANARAKGNFGGRKPVVTKTIWAYALKRMINTNYTLSVAALAREIKAEFKLTKFEPQSLRNYKTELYGCGTYPIKQKVKEAA